MHLASLRVDQSKRRASVRRLLVITVGTGLMLSGMVTRVQAKSDGSQKGMSASPEGVLRNLVLAQDVFSKNQGAVLGIDQAGVLWAYPTGAGSQLGKPRAVGTGFGGIDVYPLDGVGLMGQSARNLLSTNKILGVNCAGDMHRYYLMYGGWDDNDLTLRVGKGWRTGFQIVPVGDLTGDTNPDVLAVPPDSGKLRLYRFDHDRFRFPYPQVGNGWLGYRLLAAGDLTGDGQADVLGVAPDGDLFLYPGKGDGSFSRRIKIGYGWKGWDVLSGGDVDGDGLNDLMARSPSGDLFFYKGLGGSRFAKKQLAGQGFGPPGTKRDCSGKQPMKGTIIPLPWHMPNIIPHSPK